MQPMSREIWSVVSFLVAVGVQFSGITSQLFANICWIFAGSIIVWNYWPKKTFLSKSNTTHENNRISENPAIGIVCPGSPPFWDDLPGYQIRRVGVVNNLPDDLEHVSVYLEDIQPWDHNLGAVRLREKDDVPPSSSHVFKSDTRITPGDTKYFDVLEKHSSNVNELLLCYADCVSPNRLPFPRDYYIITLRVTAANQRVRNRRFFLRIREGDKVNLEPFGNAY